MRKVAEMRNFLFGFALIFGVSLAYGQSKLDPVSSIVSRIKAPNDTSDLAYLGMRCGLLYGAIANYFEINGNASDAQTIRDLRVQSDSFKKVALELNLRVNKMSTDAIKQQGASIANAYVQIMSEGKRVSNNAFTPFIQSDLAACKVEADGFSQLAAKIK